MPRNTCIYAIAGPITFRLSSSGITTNYVTQEEKGTNLQNIEKSIRALYLADEGKILAQRDQSGAEALIVAYLCRDGKFRSLFLNNIKPHVFVALHLFADIWQQKMNEFSGDIKFDVKELLDAEIPDLPKHPFWKQLDKLIKSSDKWPPQQRYYYISKQVCHCVTADTEVLTYDKGWIKISEINKNDQIAVWNTDNSIKFEVPKNWFEYEINETIIEINADEINQCVTFNHKIPYYSNYKYHNKPASEVAKQHRPSIPNSGLYIGGPVNLPEHVIKLLVAIQADGEIISNKGVRFHLKRPEKLSRLRQILKEGQYVYTYNPYADGTHSFIVSGISDIISLFQGVKIWDKWLLQFSTTNLQCLINELKYWDGGLYKQFNGSKREEYRTAIYKNAEWIKTICHLVFKQGTVNSFKENTWVVGINNRQKAAVKRFKYIPYSGKVYCPSTSTGYFLIRRNNKISITGNSHNYDISPPAFRVNVLEKSKGKIALSKYDSEKYGAFYFSLFPEIKEWHQEVRNQLEATRTLYNLFGWPRYFTGEFSERFFKEAYSHTPQSTVACITRNAYIDTQTFIEEHKVDWDLLGDTHDSLFGQCPDSDIEVSAFTKVMKTYIEPELTSFRGEKFRMKSECGVGYNWGPYDEKTNPKGLKDYNDN